MGETRRKKDRRPPIKPTEKLPPLPIAMEKTLNDKQRAHCLSIVDKMLDDESSISFSKPVTELWDIAVLPDYTEKIKKPMDLGTVRDRISSKYIVSGSDLFDPNGFREEARLVFFNAILYNGRGSDLGRLSSKFIHFIDTELAKLPVPERPVGEDSPGDGSPAESSKKIDRNEANGGDESVEHPKSDRKSRRPSTSDVDDQSFDETLENDQKENGDMDDKDEQKNSEKDDDEGSGPEDRIDDADEDSKEKSAEDEERDRLEEEISKLSKARLKADAALAEIELEKNTPLTYDENSKLRDEIEALPWELSQKVVQILRKYVDAALQDCEESDPEYVTLEFSTVEPKLLREIEALIRPDRRYEDGKAMLANTDRDLEAARRKLKRLTDNALASGKKKKSKKSR